MPTIEPSWIYLRNKLGNFVKIKSAEMEAFIESCPDDTPNQFKVELERRWEIMVKPLEPRVLSSGNTIKLSDADQHILDTIKSELLEELP